MFDELIPVIGGLLDKLANSEEGQKCVDDLATVIGRLYKQLTVVHGIPESVAAAIVAGIGKSSSTGK